MKKRFKKIYIEITNNCNLNCDFCIKNKRKQKNISKDEFKYILKKIRDYTDYLYMHVLGEPLIHPEINELIGIASTDFKVNITTNGYLIEKIKYNKNIRQLNISLHSFNENYKLTLKEYLDNIFSSVDALLKNNTYISFRLWVYSKFNDAIIDYINRRYNTKIPYDVKNYTINDHLFINNFHEFIWPNLKNNTYDDNGYCYGLIDHIGILVDGTVIPCCLDSRGDINLGNIYNDELDNILNSERATNIINGFENKKKVEELCKHCKFIDKI